MQPAFSCALKRVVLATVLFAFVSGCGGGGGDTGGYSVDGTAGPNAGNGRVSITNPTDLPSFVTDDATVEMKGLAFYNIPAAEDPCRQLGGFGALLAQFLIRNGPDYEVTARNEANQANVAHPLILRGCISSLLTWEFEIPLELGENLIRVTARDSAGNIGRDRITITRVRDTIPPAIASKTPVNGAVDTSRNPTIAATFTELMAPTSINSTTFRLKDQLGRAVKGTVSYNSVSVSSFDDTTAGRAYFVADSALVYGALYTATISRGARDLAGNNALEDDYVWSFTIVSNPDMTPPSVQSVSPVSGSYCAPPTGVVAATFNEDLAPSSVNDTTFLLEGPGNQTVGGAVSYGNRTATFAPDASLDTGAFTATLTAGIKDLAGNATALPFAWNFTTPTTQLGTWSATNYRDAPDPSDDHVAAWTGSEMIVARGPRSQFGRYDPAADTWVLGDGAPQARFQESVWTGTHMLVWGGLVGTTSVGRGSAFDPDTNLWTPMSLNGEPSGRYEHTAVWTGREMIVWGGRDTKRDIKFGDGATYDPATDTWRPVSKAGALSARHGHSAIWTGSEMIIWGGIGSSVYGDGARYNPVTDTWTPITATGAPSARSDHSAVWTGSEMIVWGSGIYEIPGAGAALYNPTTDSWRPVETLCAPSKRRDASVIWTGVQMIVWGGRTYFDELSDGAAYNPVTNTWSQLTDTLAPTARYSHTAVWTGTEMIVWGGRAGSSFNYGGRLTP